MRAYFDDIGGIRTRYFRAGSGSPMLLLHGVGMTADSWCRTLAPLSEDHDVGAPDLLASGFTESGSYTGGPPHQTMLDHLEALIEHLRFSKIVLVGSSFGAALSVLLYHRRPDAFSSMVLVSSGSTFKSAEELADMYRRAAKNGSAALADPSLQGCQERLGRLFYDPSRIPQELLLMQLTPYALPTALPSFETRMLGMTDAEAMRPFAIGNRLSTVKIPVLGIWGKQDPRGDYEGAVEKLSSMPNVQLEAIDQCGHLPHLEQSERFLKILRAFLYRK
jgi:pimeloyl-ACP methyl ester carboxylesterase